MRLVFDSVLSFLPFFRPDNVGIPKMPPPVMRLEVDFEMSFTSLIVDKSITDLESFFNAEGVRLLSISSKAASVSNASVSTLGQIFYGGETFSVQLEENNRKGLLK